MFANLLKCPVYGALDLAPDARNILSLIIEFDTILTVRTITSKLLYPHENTYNKDY